MSRVKVNKYMARVTEIDGHVFRSKKEAKRYGELKLMMHTGLIKDLKVGTRYDLVVNDVKVCWYRDDFSYVCDDVKIVEDVKGMRSGAAYEKFRIKAKLMKALYGIEVVEV